MPLSKKLIVIFIIMILIRIGTVIPIPFVNADYMKSVLSGESGFMTMFTGGSFSRMSLFALSISPYITSSIVIQLLSVIFPKLEEMQKDGQTGHDQYQKIVSGTGIVLSAVQAVAMAAGLGRMGLLSPYNAATVIGAAAIWTAGAAMLIVVGTGFDNFDLGSGISMILLCNIVSGVPQDAAMLYELFLSNGNIAKRIVAGVLIVCIYAAAIACCVRMNTAKKSVHVIQSRHAAGKSQTNELPIPLLTCNVMPYIFASSLFSVPLMLEQFFPYLTNGICGTVFSIFSTSNWFSSIRPWMSVGAVLFVLLTYLFTLFYIDFAFSPKEIADNFKKQGTIVSGIRPGKPTEEYLRKIIRKTAMLGNTLMVALILALTALTNLLEISSLSLGGTSIVIAVSVIYDIQRRMETQKCQYRVICGDHTMFSRVKNAGRNRAEKGRHYAKTA